VGVEERFLATYQDVAEAVRDGRQSLGLSQSELASQTGVEREFITDLEAGHPRAELPKLLDVLNALNIHAVALPAPPPPKIRMEEVNLIEVVARFA